MRAPNFIVILADDLGYGDLGCDGGRIIATPNLDAMAAEGVRFTDYYASANVCTPSRAGLLTGSYAIRHGLAHQVIQPADVTGLPPHAFTLPRGLGPDYARALIGKWHLGHAPPHWPPTLYGFDTFSGVPYSHDMRPIALYDAHGAEVRLTEARVDFARLTARFFASAVDFAQAHRSQPFFILLALTAPHTPLHPNPDEETGSAAGAYGEVVEEIDRQVGRLLARLAALGLDEETLVVFTSDNGPWFEGSSGVFRDRKGGAGFDGGYRVPLIARQRGVLPAGAVRSGLASNLDLAPTLMALAGRAWPADAPCDGADLTGVLMRDETSPHEAIVLFDNARVAAIRTARWKWVVRSYYRTFDLDLGARGYPLLFDLTIDPAETYSVRRLYPEVAADMAARLERAQATYEPLAAAFPPYHPPPGAEAHPD